MEIYEARQLHNVVCDNFIKNFFLSMDREMLPENYIHSSEALSTKCCNKKDCSCYFDSLWGVSMDWKPAF